MVPNLGAGNFRGQDPLYEPLGAMQAYQQATGQAANPSNFGQAGGIGQPPVDGTAFRPKPPQQQQRYQKGYQMPRRAGMLKFVTSQIGR